MPLWDRHAGPCDDGDPCTVSDSCQPIVGCAGEPKDCGADTPCAVGSCGPDGACVYTIFHDGQIEGSEDFDDGLVPGELPAGWTATSGPGWAWSVSPALSASPPNGLRIVPAGPAAGVAKASGPTVALSGGATLSYKVWAALPAGDCEDARLEVHVLGVVVDTLCSSTQGWTTREAPLAGVEGLTIAPSFVLVVGQGGAEGVLLALDDIVVSGTYGCDDADPCTLADSCVFGVCQGTADPECL